MSILLRSLNRLTATPALTAEQLSPLRLLARSISSKQANQTPGEGCCKGGPDGCKTKKEDKRKGKDEKKIPKECIDNPCCPDPPQKYDEEFAHLLKHKERTHFQKTWNECPPRRTIQKVVCSGALVEQVKEPCKEKKKVQQQQQDDCNLLTGKCPKIKMPGCKPAMVHEKCKNWPVPSGCEKIQAPYPSFSECARPRPKPKHPTECHCLALRSMCEVYTMYRKKGKKIKVKGGGGKKSK